MFVFKGDCKRAVLQQFAGAAQTVCTSANLPICGRICQWEGESASPRPHPPICWRIRQPAGLIRQYADASANLRERPPSYWRIRNLRVHPPIRGAHSPKCGRNCQSAGASVNLLTHLPIY
jgi:hypothetical protein